MVSRRCALQSAHHLAVHPAGCALVHLQEMRALQVGLNGRVVVLQLVQEEQRRTGRVSTNVELSSTGVGLAVGSGVVDDRDREGLDEDGLTHQSEI